MVFGTELADLTVGGMAARTEYRASRALALVRVGTSFFAYIPLFVWGSLADPWVTVGAAVAATAATVLAGAAIVGFSFGFGVVQAGAVLLLMTGWVFAVLPDVTIKLPSDLLGFVLWYVISAVFIRELRMLAQLTDRAQREAQRSAVETEAARMRERVHGEIHGYLLPVVVVCDLHLADVAVRETMTALVSRGLRILAISGPATGSCGGCGGCGPGGG